MISGCLTAIAMSASLLSPGGAHHSTRASAASHVLFNGSSLRSWGLNQSARPGRVRLIKDPTGGDAKVLQFTTLNSDIAPLTPTDNPRSQLVTPVNIVKPNVPFWESYEVYIPRTFPLAATRHGWFSLGTPFYGAPFVGTPSTGLAIDHEDFRWQGNAYAPTPWQIYWQKRVKPGVWTRFTWRIDPAVEGFAELYVDGSPVVVTSDGKRTEGVRLRILDPTDHLGPWFSDLQDYYKHNEMRRSTVDFKNFKIGTTRAAAVH